MGGFGALKLALSNPQMFGFCGPIAPACLSFKNILEGLRKDPEPWLKTGEEARETFIDIKSIFGDDMEYQKEYEISELINRIPADTPKPVIYATCGLEDNLRNESLFLKEAIKDRGFDFTYEEWPGDHDWDFFNDALKKTIEFWYRGYEV
jgi:S-formylglutathione hydrolase FrmB